MDRQQFDDLTVEMADAPRSRRRALRLVAATAFAGLLARPGLRLRTVAAAGCRTVAKPCRRARQCCSGICRGRRGKKTCRGHGAGTCKQQGQQLVCTAPDLALSLCNNDRDCACVRTTSGTNFCGDFLVPSTCTTCSACAKCDRDVDCVRQGFPKGSACVPFTAGRCAGLCPGATRCMVPCGTVPRTPEP